jgi:transposase-like protein
MQFDQALAGDLGTVHPLLEFAPEIRRIIYTTNSIESLNPSSARSSRTAATSRKTTL